MLLDTECGKGGGEGIMFNSVQFYGKKHVLSFFYGKISKNFTIILVNTFHSEHFSTITYARYLPQSRNEMSMGKHPQYY